MIKKTFVTELNKEFSIYGLITFFDENKDNKKLDLLNPSNNLKFEVKKTHIRPALVLNWEKYMQKDRILLSAITFLILICYVQRKIKQLVKNVKYILEIIDIIKILLLQVETENYLNPINISLNTNNVIQQLIKYNKYRYRFVLETFYSVLVLKMKQIIYF